MSHESDKKSLKSEGANLGVLFPKLQILSISIFIVNIDLLRALQVSYILPTPRRRDRAWWWRDISCVCERQGSTTDLYRICGSCEGTGVLPQKAEVNTSWYSCTKHTCFSRVSIDKTLSAKKTESNTKESQVHIRHCCSRRSECSHKLSTEEGGHHIYLRIRQSRFHYCW